jgi:hypothetical protein
VRTVVSESDSLTVRDQYKSDKWPSPGCPPDNPLGLTDIGDDPDGKLFAKFREGLSKWIRRHGFDLISVWSRERMSGGQAEVVHCHLLFHLPTEYRHARGCSTSRPQFMADTHQKGAV